MFLRDHHINVGCTWNISDRRLKDPLELQSTAGEPITNSDNTPKR